MPPASSALRAVVVGAGAWGLPAAAELARRGCLVTLVDALDPRGREALGSSAGPTRIWRLAHPDAPRVRLAQRAAEGWRRLERDALGRDGLGKIAVERGILWRDTERGSLAAVAAALRGEGAAFCEVEARAVARFLPGLVADSRDALFQPQAGIVMAEAAMRAHAELFARAARSGGGGGSSAVWGERVVEVFLGGGGERRDDDDGGARSFRSSTSSSSAPVTVFTDKGRAIEADVVVLAPGTGATDLSDLISSPSSSSSPSLSSSSSSSPSSSSSSPLFPRSVSRLMRPRLQQTAHVSRPRLTDALPCWYDGPREVPPTEEEERERERREASGAAEEAGAGSAAAAREEEGRGSRPRFLPGLYAMPTPGVGYKIGLDAPVRFLGGGGGEEEEEAGGEDGDDGAYEPRLDRDDFSREPSDAASAAIEARVRESLPGLLDPSSSSPSSSSSPLHSVQVCTWTDSPDGRFVVDVLPRSGGRVVVAAGCSGEGFKFSALMGTVLADLAQAGRVADEDVACFGLGRFDKEFIREGGKAGRHVLGR